MNLVRIRYEANNTWQGFVAEGNRVGKKEILVENGNMGSV